MVRRCLLQLRTPHSSCLYQIGWITSSRICNRRHKRSDGPHSGWMGPHQPSSGRTKWAGVSLSKALGEGDQGLFLDLSGQAW